MTSDLLKCCKPPKGIARALAHMRGGLLPDVSRERLCRLLSDPTRRNYVRHAASIDAGLIDLIDRLPAAALSPGLLRLCNDADARDEVLYCADALRRVLPPPAQMSAWQALKALRERDHVLRWFTRHVIDAPFPPPPWTGTSTLIPVTDGATLHSVARQFANCLETYIHEILGRRRYVYTWRGEEPATLLLISDAYFGWTIGPITGPRNVPVSQETEAAIRAVLSEAGFRPRMFPVLEMARW